MHVRKAAYSTLQKQLAAGRYLLPLAFADESIVVRDTVIGPADAAGRATRLIDFGMC